MEKVLDQAPRVERRVSSPGLSAVSGDRATGGQAGMWTDLEGRPSPAFDSARTAQL
jgi:hypothetical protein